MAILVASELPEEDYLSIMIASEGVRWWNHFAELSFVSLDKNFLAKSFLSRPVETDTFHYKDKVWSPFIYNEADNTLKCWYNDGYQATAKLTQVLATTPNHKFKMDKDVVYKDFSEGDIIIRRWNNSKKSAYLTYNSSSQE